MASYTCPFCGKETKLTFFIFGYEHIQLGYERKITCCADCKRKYEAFIEKNGTRIQAKLYNIHGKNHAVPESVLVRELCRYQKEFELFKEQRSHIKIGPKGKNWYWCNEDGYFWVDEVTIVDLDPSESGYFQTKPMEYLGHSWEAFPFNKSDVTKLEYKLDNIIRSGAFLNNENLVTAFIKIRLNDHKQMSYRPTFVDMTYDTTSPDPVNDIMTYAYQQLSDFKKAIGSDLPIKPVTAFD